MAGKHGTINGVLSTLQTIVGQSARNFGITNSDAGVTLPAIVAQDDFAVEALVYVRSDGAVAGRLFQSTNLNIYFSATRIFLTATGVTGSTWFTALNSFQYNKWFHMVATRRRSDGAVAVYVDGASVLSTTGGTEALDWGGIIYLFNNGGAAVGVRAMDGDCQFIRFLNRYMEADEVKRRYQPIARKVMYELRDYLLPTLANVTAGQTIPGTDRRVENGTFAVREDAATGEPYICCVGAGALSRRNLEAYNTYEWEAYKQAGNANYVQFISAITSVAGVGYRVGHEADDQLNLTQTGVDHICRSSVGWAPAAQRYKFRITRSVANVFTAYIRGGAFVNWTLFDSSVYGSNPATNGAVTTSLYSVMQFGAGDRVYEDRQFFGPVAP